MTAGIASGISTPPAANIDLQLAFDFVNDGIAATDAADEYSLLFKTTAAADFMILDSDGMISGNNVLFNVNSLLLGNGIITLGVNAVATPEPASWITWLLFGLSFSAYSYRQFRRKQ